MNHKDHRIYSHFNKVGFLHVEYVKDPGIEKYKFFVGKRVGGEMVGESVHYVDPNDMRWICYQIMSQDMDEHVSRKGTIKDELVTLSRIMVIRRDEKDENKFFMKIGHGPGVRGPNGIVLPDSTAAKETWTFVSIVFKQRELITMALAIRDWMMATSVASVLSLPLLVKEDQYV